MSLPVQILDAFVRDGWKSKPFEAMLELAHSNPADLFQLLRLGIERGGKNATFLSAAVSLVPENMLQELTLESVNSFLQDKENKVAENVIAYISLQAVKYLQPFLSQLFFESTPNIRTYYASWPWRGASDEDTAKLLEYLPTTPSPDESLRTFQSILQARNPRYISNALKCVAPEALRFGEAFYLAEVGFDGPNRRLYSENVFHIRFTEDVLACRAKRVVRSPSNHPTWNLPVVAGEHRFGGTAESKCAICDGPLHNLLTIDPIPESMSFLDLSRLEIVTCLSCVGWSKSPLFFRHDNYGNSIALDSGPLAPRFPAVPLKETLVKLSPTPDRWTWQDWALSNGRENLHRLGGHPTWIQNADYPNCPSCNQLMMMLLQLDSELPRQDGREWLWGSGGICYVFWCGTCNVSASFWQCT